MHYCPCSRSCPQPQPFQQNRNTFTWARTLDAPNRWRAESKFISRLFSPHAIPPLRYSFPCSHTHQTHTALHQTEQKRVWFFPFEGPCWRWDCSSAQGTSQAISSPNQKACGRKWHSTNPGVLKQQIFLGRRFTNSIYTRLFMAGYLLAHCPNNDPESATQTAQLIAHRARRTFITSHDLRGRYRQPHIWKARLTIFWKEWRQPVVWPLPVLLRPGLMKRNRTFYSVLKAFAHLWHISHM